jgi:hypothetical protein
VRPQTLAPLAPVGTLALLVISSLLAAPGCERSPAGAGDAATPGWTDLAEAELDAAQRARLERATAAREALAFALVSRVTESMQTSGAPTTIEVCAGEAATITEAVSNEHGVRMGRTSFALRNPANAPPAWASELVAAHAEAPAVRVAPDGTLGVLSPIRLMPPCETCHGASDAIAPEVRGVIAARNPEDRATGFSAGDLRGYFWVEVGP